MRDTAFPTIWGSHPEAIFNPVMVRGQLITTIEQAPAHWGARLEDLDFTKGSRSWARMGAITQAEYQYLSPSIVLKGFSPEAIINATDANPAPLVPVVVADAIAELWQNNLDAVLLEMSILGIQTKGAAWSKVEEALEGVESAEADAITELSFAHLEHRGMLTGEALSYALARGWEASSPIEATPRGGLLMQRGESIEWTDASNIAHSGRLASDLRRGDQDAWVYEQGPRFVSGVQIAALGRVGWGQILFPAAPIASPSPASVAADEPPAQARAPLLDLGGLSPGALDMVHNVIKLSINFPAQDWRRNLQWAVDEFPETAPYVDESEAVLALLEKSLIAISKKFYGNSGLGFCLKRTYDYDDRQGVIQARVGSYNGHGFYTVVEALRGENAIIDDCIDLERLASQLDRGFRRVTEEITESAKSLGLIVGTELVIPFDLLQSHRIQNAISDLERAGVGSEITFDQVLNIVAAATEKSGFASYAAKGRSSRHTVNMAVFRQLMNTDPSGKNSNTLSLELISNDTDFVSVQNLYQHIHNPDVHPINPIAATVYFARADMQLAGQEITDCLSAIQDLSYQSAKQSRLIPLETADKAVSAMQQFISDLSGLQLAADQVDTLKVASDKINRFGLQQRYHDAIVKTSLADKNILEAWVRNELLREFQGKANDWSETTLTVRVATVASELRGNQAVALALKSSSKGNVLYTNAVLATDNDVTQSRESVLGEATVRYKERVGKRSRAAYIDAVAFSDPELCSILAGDSAALEKETKATGSYEDTGVVAGFARKDIMGFSHDELLSQAARMSPDQKAKYIKRDLIWPRKSFEQMREEGLHLHTAIALDTLWRALPKEPKSVSEKHIRSFTTLISEIKFGVTDMLDRIGRGEIEDLKTNDDRLNVRGDVLNNLFERACRRGCANLTVQESYQRSDFKIRGLPYLKLTEFTPFSSRSLMKEFEAAAWENYLKSKKVARRPEGSRVQRDEVLRVGDDHRNGSDVTTEDFLKTFAFSGVEYGNWTNQLERKNHMNLAYDSMLDFASLMRWEPMSLSLAGRLGLCIGSRGHGGSNPAAAHFEPVNFAMNLTRMNGAGNVSHEWWHAIDYHYGRIHTGRSMALSSSYAFGLQKPGVLPVINESTLRAPLRQAFRDLQVAIMREPAPGSDPDDIENYTALSPMMIASNAEGEYWAEPLEMFARAMESWVCDQLSFQNKRNDYLVQPGLVGGVYPSKEHMERINKWVSPLLDAIEMEVRLVSHPVLGDVKIPVLNSERHSAFPLTPEDLVGIATNEMRRLFGRFSPKLMVFDSETGPAGFWNAGLNVLGLNQRFSDTGTFYHESWHGCASTLLTGPERVEIGRLFSAEGPLSGYVVDTMRAVGFPEVAVIAALDSADEMQAYAFELWATGHIDLSNESIGQFYKVKGFADGVVEIAAGAGAEEARHLFGRFMDGSLAVRSTASHELHESSGVVLTLSAEQGQGDGINAAEEPARGLRIGMR